MHWNIGIKRPNKYQQVWRDIGKCMTSDGLYQYTVKLFRINNVPETLQQMFNCVISELYGFQVYINDVIMHNKGWDNWVSYLAKLIINLNVVELGLSQLCFENCLVRFWAVLKNSAYYAQNYAPKIKIMLEIWLFY